MPEKGNARRAGDESSKGVNHESKRWALLSDLEHRLERPMIILGQVWLVLLVMEMIWDIEEKLEFIAYTIWAIFVLDFLLRVTVAPYKLTFLRKNTITVISLMIPAVRLLHIFRFGHHIFVLRSRSKLDVNVDKVAGSVNRLREIIETLVEQIKSNKES